MPLPVAGEVYGLAALQCQMGNAVHLIAIRDAAISQPKTIARRLWPRFNGACPPSPGRKPFAA